MPMSCSLRDPQVEEGERRRVEEEMKSEAAEERHQKLVNEFRKLGEEYAALQVGFFFWSIHILNFATSFSRPERWKVEREGLFWKEGWRLPLKKQSR